MCELPQWLLVITFADNTQMRVRVVPEDKRHRRYDPLVALQWVEAADGCDQRLWRIQRRYSLNSWQIESVRDHSEAFPRQPHHPSEVIGLARRERDQLFSAPY